MMPMMEIGVRIAERLEFLGMSQAELARRAHIPQTTINSLIKKPRRSSPHLVRIARELLTTPGYLTGDTDDPLAEFGAAMELSSDERDLVELFRGLSPKDQAAILQLSRSLAHSAASPRLQAAQQEFRR